MANSLFRNVRIGGIAAAVPTNVERASDYASSLSEDEIAKFVEGTGVLERRVAHEKQTTSDLCFMAAISLIEKKRYTPNSINALIFVTQTADYLQPATSHILHKRLGLSIDCAAFDVNLGCSGWIFGINSACSLINGGGYERVLLLCGEVERPNPLIPVKDHILFGCAGTATIIERGNDNVAVLLRSDGKEYDSLIIPGGNLRNPIKNENKYFSATYPRMDGETVFSFSITKVPRAFMDFYSLYNFSASDFDYCILHQANTMIMKMVSKKAGFSWDKTPVSLDRYGNTSSATIPLTIADLCEREDEGKVLHLIASGFGIGLSWGVASFHVSVDDVLPLISTDDYFKEACHVDC